MHHVLWDGGIAAPQKAVLWLMQVLKGIIDSQKLLESNTILFPFYLHSQCFWDDDGNHLRCYVVWRALLYKNSGRQNLSVDSEMFSLRRTYFKECFFIAFVGTHLLGAGFLLWLRFMGLYKDIKALQQSLTHRCSSHLWLQALNTPELQFMARFSPSLLCQTMNSEELTNIFYVSPTTANRCVNMWVVSGMGERNAVRALETPRSYSEPNHSNPCENIACDGVRYRMFHLPQAT